MKGKIRIALLALALGSLVWGFRALLFDHAPHVFSNPQEDMSFAWYVPLFSLYVLWTERRQLVESAGRPDGLALVLLVPSLALGFLGVRGIQVRLEEVGLIGLLIALPWAVFGRATARRVAFPALFLLFCIPLATFLDVVTVHLRLLASSAAFAVLKGCGADIVRQGTMVAASDGAFAIDVADPCSGLRSLFALMALTAAYAYFTQRTWFRRAVLFAASIPLAILGNVARIVTICLVASFASYEFATGFYHDYSGYVVFAVAILSMVSVGGLLERLPDSAARREEPASGRPAAAAPSSGRVAAWAVPLLAVALTVAMMAVQATSPEVTVAEAPAVSLGELAGFESEPVEVSEAERTVLPSDTRLEKRLYRNAGGEWFLVTLVVGGREKSSIHRPELCLPAQGHQMTSPQTVRVAGTDWRFIRLARGAQGGDTGFAYTFFNQAGYRTASHTARIFRDVWDRSLHGRIDRWVMVTVGSSRSEANRLAEFLRKIGEKTKW